MGARVFLRRPSTSTLRGRPNPPPTPHCFNTPPRGPAPQSRCYGEGPLTFARPRSHGLKSLPPPIFLLPRSLPPLRFPNTLPRGPALRPRNHAAGPKTPTRPRDPGRRRLPTRVSLLSVSPPPAHSPKTAPRSLTLTSTCQPPGSSYPNTDQMLWAAASFPSILLLPVSAPAFRPF